MKVLRRLESSRYTVVVARWEGELFLYLKDRKEETESLGVIKEKELKRVDELWERHLKEDDFCLPCELLLIPELKVLKGENAVAEIGLTLERLEKFKEEVGDERG
ncbi:hypothetical protein [Thermovibrio sp.]